MQWIEITIHTNTNGADAMADVFFSLGIAGVSIEDARDYCLMGCVEEQRSGRVHQWTSGGFTQWPICIDMALHGGVLNSYGDRVWLSLMNQYTPLPQVRDFPEIDRKVTRHEYDRLIRYALSLGIENAFIQEGGTAAESFIPAFDYQGL